MPAPSGPGMDRKQETSQLAYTEEGYQQGGHVEEDVGQNFVNYTELSAVYPVVSYESPDGGDYTDQRVPQICYR